MTQADRFRRFGAAALPIVALVAFALVQGAAIMGSARAGTLGFDFLAYDGAVRRLLDGGALYDPASDVVAGVFGLYLYPPPFVLLALPFTLLQPATAAWTWTALLVVVFGAAVAAMPVARRVKWLVVLLAALDYPVAHAIKLGQVGPILLLMFALGWRFMDRPSVLGLATAVGSAIKIQPLILFGWALLTGRRRAVVVGLAGLLAIALAGTLAAGASSWADLAAILARVSQPLATPHSYTPGRIASELGLPESVAWGVQWLNWVLAGAAALYGILRTTPVASYLAVVVVSQLVSPILWDHYALILLLPVAWLLERGRTWAVAIPLVTMVPLVAVTPPIAYPLLFWVTLLAVLREGRDAPATRWLPAQASPGAGDTIAR